jgi:valyl-tRNA synthetase
MKKLENKYNFQESEKKWQKYWEDNEIFKFDWENNKRENIFSIDTDPPTVSGTLHMGHIFSFTQKDFIARFQRMTGKNVFYPIGFDDNGLPTERYVEKLKGIKGKEMPRDQFCNVCKENITKAEDVDFFNLFHSISHSYDWTLKYQTISKTSQHVSQLSFLDLYNKGVLYRKDEPCIWDVVDQTALAQTEIEDKEFESQMNYLSFSIEDEENIEIMTTRPELLPACVALMCHPNKYEKYKGKLAITPLGIKVPIVADIKVDEEKGTGFVMCCTFGDQTDIEWWKKYNLELKIILNERGQLNLENVKDLIDNEYLELDGLKLKDARIKIIELLEKNGKIVREPEKIKHAVKVGERSKFPIEFLITKQWNIKVLNIKKELHENTNKIKWHPDWMKSRMHDWIDGLSWDWCISRQRFSGIPVPVWYSKRKGEEGKIILPTAEQLPIDPMIDLPNDYSKDEVQADTDVLDTWATSAVSPQLNSWGITNELSVDKERFNTLPLPFDLRGNAHEIIRTWDFCTLVKAFYHQNTIPWKNLMISGWCLATDKTKMSKSKGNIIDPINLIKTKSADALRYWAGNSTLGMDTAYSEEQISIGQKLITKLFNSAKFVEINFLNFENITFTSAKNDIENDLIFEIIDKWLISKLASVIKKTTKFFETFEYNRALETIENFFKNDFCDNYLEIIKVRSYGITGLKYQGNTLKQEEIDKINKGQESAVRTIYYVFNSILKIFAPFIPSICDEIFSSLYENEFNKTKSISAKGNWPVLATFLVNENLDKVGENLLKIIAEVRKYKSEKNISIKENIKKLIICDNLVNEVKNDITEELKNVCNVEEIEFIKADKLEIKFN